MNYEKPEFLTELNSHILEKPVRQSVQKEREINGLLALLFITASRQVSSSYSLVCLVHRYHFSLVMRALPFSWEGAVSCCEFAQHLTQWTKALEAIKK